MEFGVQLPHVGPLATRENIITVAQRAEELGFHSIWVSDHIITPVKMESAYPGGRYPVQVDTDFLEPLSTLLFAAAVTERVRLGVSVLVVPQRNPVLLAKELASLDVLSGGRLIFGAGAGWMKEEFEALNVPFRGHGPRTSEYLEIIRRSWTDDVTSFEGRYYKLPEVGVFPKPLQKPHPPIWVGGWADGALERVVKYGDAWHAGGPPEWLGDRWAKIRGLAREHGRDPDSIAFTLRGDGLRLKDTETAIEQLRAYRDLGVSFVMLTITGPDVATIGQRMENFLRDIAPNV